MSRARKQKREERLAKLATEADQGPQSPVETEAEYLSPHEAEIVQQSLETSTPPLFRDEIDYDALKKEVQSFPPVLQELAFSIARGEPLRAGSSKEIIESPSYSAEGVIRAISVGIKLQYPYLFGKERE